MTLIAEYGFNEGSGTTVTDSSGNGRDMPFGGSNTWIAGPSGGALSLSGGASVAVDSSMFSGNATIMCWYRHTLDATDQVAVAGLLGTGPARFVIYSYRSLNGTAASPQVTSRNSTGSLGSEGQNGTEAETDVWHHAAATWASNGTIVVYLDGVAVSTTTGHGTVGPGAVTSIAAMPPMGAFPETDGITGADIKDFRVFDTVLTATDVASYMNTPVGAVAPVIASTGALGIGDSTVSPGIPSGVVDGSLVVAYFAIAWPQVTTAPTLAAITPPEDSGWSIDDVVTAKLTSDGFYLAMFRAHTYATGPASGTATFTLNVVGGESASDSWGLIRRITGGPTSGNPWSDTVRSGAATTSGTTVTIPSFTPSRDNSLLDAIFSFGAAATSTWPSGWTRDVHDITDGIFDAGSRSQAAAAATGSLVWTSGSPGTGIVMVSTIRPPESDAIPVANVHLGASAPSAFKLGASAVSAIYLGSVALYTSA